MIELRNPRKGLWLVVVDGKVTTRHTTREAARQRQREVAARTAPSSKPYIERTATSWTVVSDVESAWRVSYETQAEAEKELKSLLEVQARIRYNEECTATRIAAIRAEARRLSHIATAPAAKSAKSSPPKLSKKPPSIKKLP